MTARVILQVFDQYQKARVSFVQTVADLASRPQNVDCLENAGVLDLLRPLLSDVVPSIQQTAAIALGRLANHDDRVAQAVIRRDIMPQLLRNIDKQNKFFKKAALFVLRAVAKHSPEMASVIVHGGGLEAMVICLEDFDLGVKEAAAWALGYVARHNKSLAQAAIDTGAVPLLVLCLQEPELCLKQISASALCDISKHSEDLAQIVVDAGAVPFLAKAISNPDPKLKINIYYLLQRQVLSALSSIAKHSVELAEIIVEAEVFPDVLVHMAHPDDNVDRAAANLTRDVCKHTLELAQLIVNTGGIGALVELVGTSKSDSRLPAIMALGYIAGHSDQLAIAVIGSKGVVQLAIVLQEETEDHILSITVWALGQIGKHTPEHAKALAVADVFRKLLELYMAPRSSEDLKAKCKGTMKQVLQKCMHIEALEPLLCDAPPEILKYIIGQFSKILPNDARARRMFVTTGGLKKVQEIQAEPGSMLLEFITIINCCFPEEIVRYYSPGYPDTLLEAVEQYQPKCPSVFTMDQKMSDEFSNSSMSLLHYNEERG
ncbi:sperm-associated antigen 6-like isoform X1 [Neodiprion virginianus]|uniref:sperm-associated antigen 6-like isoform X1 n=1 Tax=Neodiprion virginianus TaxID=2961670 RepID=UPI001EE76464|nr:sperm-associated antigen 6-like isoform X1 [Neodiprion virginianus]